MTVVTIRAKKNRFMRTFFLNNNVQNILPATYEIPKRTNDTQCKTLGTLKPIYPTQHSPYWIIQPTLGNTFNSLPKCR